MKGGKERAQVRGSISGRAKRCNEHADKGGEKGRPLKVEQRGIVEVAGPHL